MDGSLTLDDLINRLGEESVKCISCGFCDSVCPTYSASEHDPVITARGRAQLGMRLFDDMIRKGSTELSVGESFYSCLDCHACVQVCPTGVDAGRVSDIGKRILSLKYPGIKKQERPEAGMIVSATMKFMNPLGVREKCADWAKGMKFDTESTTILYTGNMYQLMAYTSTMEKNRVRMGEGVSKLASQLASRFSSLVKMASVRPDKNLQEDMNRNLRNVVTLLNASGVSHDYLREEEPYPGTLIYDLGYYREFSEYAKIVTKIFKSRGYRRIVTVDPHTHELLRDVYPRYVEDFDFEILYYLDLVDSSLFKKGSERVVFHEPCHFVLSELPYNKPLDILQRLHDTTLPDRSGKRTMCCGGPDELLFSNLSSVISEERYSQLKNTNAERIVTACPICYSNLSKHGVTSELAEILVDALK